MPHPPLRVVIVGGGVAGLETLTALRALAGDRVALTLVAPEDEFVYRPLTATEPYSVGRLRQVSLDRAAMDAGAPLVAATIDAVDPGEKTVTTSTGSRLEYDALVLAVGARPEAAVAHALTWDDRFDADMIGGLLQEAEQGFIRSLAVMIPPGPAWPLRAYELALLITRDADSMNARMQTTIVTPDPSPLAILGPRALRLVSAEVERAGIAVVSAVTAEVEPGPRSTVVLQPSGEGLEVDRVLALPALRGRPIAGIPTDADGFIEVDEHCRVPSLEGVWAVGDGTAFPVKSGGLASEQGDVAAEDIAAIAGAAVEPRAFDVTLVEELGGLPAGRFLREWLAVGGEPALMALPTGGVPVLTYLRRDLEAGWRGRS